MITKMKVKPFAAKLRKRLAELKAQRTKDVAAYTAKAETWRREMVTWVTANAKQRIAGITNADLRRHESSYGGVHFNAAGFFAGAPQPPTYPSDKQIRKVESLLRHLGITGQETVQMSTEEVEALMGPTASEAE